MNHTPQARPAKAPAQTKPIVFAFDQRIPPAGERVDRRVRVGDSLDDPVEKHFTGWSKGRHFRVGEANESPMLPPVQAHVFKRPKCRKSSHSCDELGVCNCSGNQCEFELPDLGPLTGVERLLVGVVVVSSIACMLLLLVAGWDRYGEVIASVIQAAASLY